MPGPQRGAEADALVVAPFAERIIRGRLPYASKHMAHLLIDPGDPSLGREAATVVSDSMIVTFAHSPHDTWEIGQEKTVR